MPFTQIMTGTNEISDEVLVALNGSYDIAYQATAILPQLATRRLNADSNNRLFSFAKINEIDSTVSAELNEYEDPDSVPLSGSITDMIAKEYGRVVTRTELADTISGGALSRAAAAAVGRDAGRWENLLAINTLAAGTNAMFAGAGTEAGLTGSDVMTRAILNRAYYQLSKSGATKDAQGFYRAILSPAQIFDLKMDQGAGSWTDVNKYAQPDEVIRGEVGAYAGFRIIESSLLVPVDQAGAGTVDVQKAVFFGADALGNGVATPVSLRVTSNDKLARFVNYGWYACMVYGIIDQGQVFVANTATSLGNNAS